MVACSFFLFFSFFLLSFFLSFFLFLSSFLSFFLSFSFSLSLFLSFSLSFFFFLFFFFTYFELSCVFHNWTTFQNSSCLKTVMYFVCFLAQDTERCLEHNGHVMIIPWVKEWEHWQWTDISKFNLILLLLTHTITFTPIHPSSQFELYLDWCKTTLWFCCWFWNLLVPAPTPYLPLCAAF